MLTVDEALALVLERARPLLPRAVPRDVALGCVLAEAVASDVDSPPHDKSIVDGYALNAADVVAGNVELVIVEEVVAGQLPQRSLSSGQATRLMTGAPLPGGADCVVMFEHTLPLPATPGASATAVGQRVRITANRVAPRQNIMSRASSMRQGQQVLSPGHLLRAIEIGLLAEVGRSQVRVIPRPRVAVLATGNELTPADQTPHAGQIRNSNGPMLAALVRQAGAEVIELGIAVDDARALRDKIEQGLSADVLVLSGGVSAGVLDLVPQVLADCGVTQVFHKVSLKPGKPLWFGERRQSADVHEDAHAAPPTLVFGLPGNPVSTLVCFELFVRPALEKLCGVPPRGLARATATLGKEFSHRGYRPTYQPAKWEGDKIVPLDWRGSGDLRTLADAAALIYFPAGDVDYPMGATLEVLLLS